MATSVISIRKGRTEEAKISKTESPSPHFRGQICEEKVIWIDCGLPQIVTDGSGTHALTYDYAGRLLVDEWVRN